LKKPSRLSTDTDDGIPSADDGDKPAQVVADCSEVGYSTSRGAA